MKKPKLIMESSQGNSCLHVMFRVDFIDQIHYVIKFFNDIGFETERLKATLADILQLNCFFSLREEQTLITDILVIDEKDKAFIFAVISGSPEQMKKLNYSIVEYCEP